MCLVGCWESPKFIAALKNATGLVLRLQGTSWISVGRDSYLWINIFAGKWETQVGKMVLNCLEEQLLTSTAESTVL